LSCVIECLERALHTKAPCMQLMNDGDKQTDYMRVEIQSDRRGHTFQALVDAKLDGEVGFRFLSPLTLTSCFVF
jgi:hypothetical protein